MNNLGIVRLVEERLRANLGCASVMSLGCQLKDGVDISVLSGVFRVITNVDKDFLLLVNAEYKIKGGVDLEFTNLLVEKYDYSTKTSNTDVLNKHLIEGKTVECWENELLRCQFDGFNKNSIENVTDSEVFEEYKEYISNVSLGCQLCTDEGKQENCCESVDDGYTRLKPIVDSYGRRFYEVPEGFKVPDNFPSLENVSTGEVIDASYLAWLDTKSALECYLGVTGFSLRMVNSNTFKDDEKMYYISPISVEVNNSYELLEKIKNTTNNLLYFFEKGFWEELIGDDFYLVLKDYINLDASVVSSDVIRERDKKLKELVTKNWSRVVTKLDGASFFIHYNSDGEKKEYVLLGNYK